MQMGLRMVDEKEFKLPDIWPALLKVKLKFLDGDLKPVKIDLKFEIDDVKSDGETDENGLVEATVKESNPSLKVVLFGKSETEEPKNT